LVCNFLNTNQTLGQSKLEGRLSLSGAFALYPMAVKWAEEFKKANPAVKIDISAGGAGKGMTDVLNNMVDEKLKLVVFAFYFIKIHNYLVEATQFYGQIIACPNRGQYPPLRR